MRKILLAHAIIFLCAFNKIAAQEKFSWEPQSSFHATAMKAFHSAEDNNMKPARDSASAMLSKAAEWKNADVPAKYNASEVKRLIQKLYDDCKAINDAVAAKKTDSKLKPLVMKAHNTFHEILKATP